ncbi:MAG TPA: hypothetical protein VFP54_05300 [Acidimicrobiales bacterium]|nr:hypothetical protein [Acidimicrobiales bacterium]
MAYNVLVALHVLTVLGAVGSVAVEAGYFGAALLDSPATRSGVARYFQDGPGWADRLLYPAAVLGAVALLTSQGRVHPDRPWIWIPASMWTAAAVVLEVVQRPAAAAVALEGGRRRRSARRGLLAASVVLALLVASAVVMTAKP